MCVYFKIPPVEKSCCKFCTATPSDVPLLRRGDEDRRHLEGDDHAGVEEEAAQEGQSQQAGRRPARVQLLAGAPSAHHDGQHRHQADVQEEELQVAHVRLQLARRGDGGQGAREPPDFFTSCALSTHGIFFFFLTPRLQPDLPSGNQVSNEGPELPVPDLVPWVSTSVGG